MKTKTKRTYKTKKVKAKIMLNKALVIIGAIAISCAVINYVEKTIEAGEITSIVIPTTKHAEAEEEKSIREQIIEMAEARNFKKTDLLLRVIECESKFNPYAVGVNRDGSYDRGIMQWNSRWHSAMTNEQAFNWKYAVERAMDYFDEGKEHLWVCYKKVK